RAGFRPSLNLHYSLEGALRDCHWQVVPAERRSELLLGVAAAEAEHTAATARAVGVVTEHRPGDADEGDGGFVADPGPVVDEAAGTEGDWRRKAARLRSAPRAYHRVLAGTVVPARRVANRRQHVLGLGCHGPQRPVLRVHEAFLDHRLQERGQRRVEAG